MKIKPLFYLFIFIFSLYTQLAATQAQKSKYKIAVLNFKTDCTDLIIGQDARRFRPTSQKASLITKDLIATLKKNKKLEVLNYEDLASLEKERKQNGKPTLSLCDAAKTLGANYLLYGEVDSIEAQKQYICSADSSEEPERLWSRITFDAHLVDVEDSKVIFSDELELTYAEPLSEFKEQSPEVFMSKLKEKAVEELAAKITEAIFPVRVASFSNNHVYLENLCNASLKPGTKLHVFLPCRPCCEGDSDEIPCCVEHKVAEVEVDKVFRNSTRARISRYSMPLAEGATCRIAMEPTPALDTDIDMEDFSN